MTDGQKQACRELLAEGREEIRLEHATEGDRAYHELLEACWADREAMAKQLTMLLLRSCRCSIEANECLGSVGE